MIVKCIANNINDLPESLRDFAFTQDENGNLDVSVGKLYAVYGKERRDGRWFYLVHTDNDNKVSFWWMPADLYAVTDDSEPAMWQEIEDGLFSYQSLGKWQVSEGLIDKDVSAIAEFNGEVANDSSFPTEETLNKLNEAFYAEQNQARHESADILSRERGWDKKLFEETEESNQ